MDFVNTPLLAAAALLFLSMVSGMVSSRFGFSFLLVFLLAGILAGENGPGGLRFDDFMLSFWVGNIALAVILLDGGLRTEFSTFRTGLKPSLALASAGVLITATVTGLAASWLLGIDWRHGLLIGAVVGSTDAAAVFALLKKSGVTLNERVASTLEIESGINDPMAVYLTLACIALILGSQNPHDTVSAGSLLLDFIQQFSIGTLVGVAGGLAMAALLARLPAADTGIHALLLVSAGLIVFAGSGLVGGSGFLAVYLFGMVVGNRFRDGIRPVLPVMDGYAWLAQAGMFLLLGLLVTPSQMQPVAWPAVGVALVLMFIARPLSVWICLKPLRFKFHEIAFISWVGLRGAVPIVLAVFPLMAGVPDSLLVFNVAFVVVLASLLLQGTTIALSARRLNIALPESADERRTRAVYGDFVLNGSAPIGSFCEFYGLPLPCDGEVRLGDWMAQAIGRPPVVGDAVALGDALLAVRAMEGVHIGMVGLRLQQHDDADDEPRNAREP